VTAANLASRSDAMMQIIPRLWSLLDAAARRQVVILVALMCAATILEMAGIGAVLPVIAIVSGQGSAAGIWLTTMVPDWFQPLDQSHLIFAAMAAMVALFALKAMVQAFVARRVARFTFGMQATLASQLLSTYLTQPYAFHMDRNSAHLLSSINNEARDAAGGINTLLMVAAEALILLGISMVLLVMSPVAGLGVVIGIAIAGAAIMAMTRRRSVRFGATMRAEHALKMQEAQQLLHGIREYIVLGRPIAAAAQFDAHNHAHAEALRAHAVAAGVPRLWLEFLAVVALALIVVTVQSTTQAALLPIIGLYTAAAFRLIPSAVRVTVGFQGAAFLWSTIDHITRELSLVPLSPPIDDRQTAPATFISALNLRNISFRYPGGSAPTLCDVNLEISSGEMVAIIGGSGAGKSTLLDIVLGLLAPDTGDIFADNRPIHANIRSWHRLIGYVPQVIFLTDDTLRRNVALGCADQEIDDVAVLDALRQAELDGLLTALPDGLNTRMGDRGVRLSGGQRQRVGIARALYRKPALLILDEATSALDQATEADILRTLSGLRPRMTIIIATHRTTISDQCDRVLLIAEGIVKPLG
jgi:ATP-binding cassette, subfamily B, bacterial PglK